MRIDHVAEHIQRVMGLPPTDQAQPVRRRDPVVALATQIDRGVESWARGGQGNTARTFQNYTRYQIRSAFELLHVRDREACPALTITVPNDSLEAATQDLRRCERERWEAAK